MTNGSHLLGRLIS